jgi:hypothetical protein
MKRFSLVWLFSLIFVCPPLIGMLHNINHTWQILPPEYKKYSFANGAIAWETHWLYNFHRFANFFPKISLDYRGREVVGYDPDKTDNMTKLVYILFYQVPGSTNYTDFGATQFIKTKNPNKVAALVAEIVVGLDQLPDLIKKNDQAVDTIYETITGMLQTEKDRAVIKGLKELKKAVDDFKQSGKQTTLEAAETRLFGTGKESRARHLLKDRPDLKEKFSSFKREAAGLSRWIDATGELLHHNLLKISSREFVTIVIGALHESSPDNPKALYPPDLVPMIWLGFLYKTLEKLSESDKQNREAIQTYYTKLGELLLGKPIELPPVELPATLKPTEAREILENLIKNPKLATLDALLFYSIKSRLFPSLIGFEETTYKSFDFSDCMENSIANFIRMMAYDLNTGSYNITTLDHRLGIQITNHPDQLRTFLENVANHDFWTELVSNIPYVPYAQCGNDKGEQIKRKPEKKAFIKLDRSDERLKNLYEQADYQVASSDEICFELRSYVRTLIIVLNHILDLNLFEDLASDALRNDFVTYYFPRLCKKLNINGYLALTEDAEEQEKSINFDEIDTQGNKIIYSFLPVKLVEYDNQRVLNLFSTKPGHGTYELKTEESEQPLHKFNLNRYINSFINHFAPTSFISLLVLNNLASYNYQGSFFSVKYSNFFNGLPILEQFSSLFALPLDNADYAFKLINTLDLHSRLLQHDNTSWLFFTLAQSQPDRDRRMNLLGQLVSRFYDDSFIDTLNSYAIETFLHDKPADPSLLIKLLDKNKLKHPELVLQQILGAFPGVFNELIFVAFIKTGDEIAIKEIELFIETNLKDPKNQGSILRLLTVALKDNNTISANAIIEFLTPVLANNQLVPSKALTYLISLLTKKFDQFSQKKQQKLLNLVTYALNTIQQVSISLSFVTSNFNIINKTSQSLSEHEILKAITSLISEAKKQPKPLVTSGMIAGFRNILRLYPTMGAFTEKPAGEVPLSLILAIVDYLIWALNNKLPQDRDAAFGLLSRIITTYPSRALRAKLQEAYNTNLADEELAQKIKEYSAYLDETLGPITEPTISAEPTEHEEKEHD